MYGIGNQNQAFQMLLAKTKSKVRERGTPWATTMSGPYITRSIEGVRRGLRMDEQAAVCATQNHALALQGEKRNVGYHGRLAKEKGQPTTQSWDQSAI